VFEQIFYRILKEIMHQGLLYADDAYFCCHEFKETGYLDVAGDLKEFLCLMSMFKRVENHHF